MKAYGFFCPLSIRVCTEMYKHNRKLNPPSSSGRSLSLCHDYERKCDDLDHYNNSTTINVCIFTIPPCSMHTEQRFMYHCVLETIIPFWTFSASTKFLINRTKMVYETFLLSSVVATFCCFLVKIDRKLDETHNFCFLSECQLILRYLKIQKPLNAFSIGFWIIFFREFFNIENLCFGKNY